LGHSTIIIGISQVIIVGVKIQVPVEIQPRQTQRYSQFIISKSQSKLFTITSYFIANNYLFATNFFS